jgi:hypothetical protein
MATAHVDRSAPAQRRGLVRVRVAWLAAAAVWNTANVTPTLGRKQEDALHRRLLRPGLVSTTPITADLLALVAQS